MIRKLKCNNCGDDGHLFRQCVRPIRSYGIILVQIDINNFDLRDFVSSLSKFNKDNCDKIYAKNELDTRLFFMLSKNIKFLMVRRKHSYGFISFVRGKYDKSDIDEL